MHVHDTLRRLAARGPSPWPVLSVCVNTRPVGPQMMTYRPYLKKRAGEELGAFLAHSPERESLAVDFARAQHYLDYDLREETKSVAIFACYAGDDLFDTIQLPIEFPDHIVAVGAVPTLFPLLRIAGRASLAGVAVADEAVTRLFSIAMGAVNVRREVRLSGETTARIAHATGSSGLAERSARALEEFARDAAVRWFAIGGEENAAAAIRHALAPDLAPHLLDTGEWDPRIGESELAAEVTAQIEARERQSCTERARELVASAAAGDALLGVDAVMTALREDRTASLYLGEDFPAGAPAWACRSCRGFGAGTRPSSCTSCGRDTVEQVALREELGARALAWGIPVHFVPTGAVPGFDDGGGVGAFPR